MKIGQPPAAPSAAGAQAQASPSNSDQAKSALLSSDFNTFLTMMTAQIRNQDPLNPMESSDFAVQLATFSGVEQQVRSNQLLESLFNQLGQMGLADLTNWVGMDARVDGPAHFSGRPLTLYPNAMDSTDQADLVVRDSRGNEIARQPFNPDGKALKWAGTDSQGNPLPSGNYAFSVENFANGELLQTTSVEHYAHIEEARFADGQTVLGLPGGLHMYASDVLSLREPA